LSYVEDCYTGIGEGLKAHGHEPTQLTFTDNARAEVTFHETVTPALKEGVVHVEADPYAHLPKYSLPEDVPLIYYDRGDLIDSACEGLLQMIISGSSERLVIGFDIKCEVEFDDQGVVSKAETKGCDVVQIATSDVVYVFKVNDKS